MTRAGAPLQFRSNSRTMMALTFDSEGSEACVVHYPERRDERLDVESATVSHCGSGRISTMTSRVRRAGIDRRPWWMAQAGLQSTGVRSLCS